MKRLIKHSVYVFICLVVLLSSCSNDDETHYNGLYPSEVNKFYTNKMASMNSSNQLTLTYNGNTFYGKDVYFELLNDKEANLTLVQTIPGEKAALLEKVSLSTLSETGYSFSGNHITGNGTSFSYAGTIQSNILTLNLSNVKLSDNQLSTQGLWYNRSCRLNWEVNSSSPLLWGIASGMISSLLNNLLLSVLHDVTFHTDGNVTASYAPLPQDADITSMLTGTHYNDRDPKDWQTFPILMATYYMKDGKVYITPEVEMLTRTLLGYQSRVETGDIVDTVISLLKVIIQWTNDGIEFVLEESTGTVTLILDKEQIEPIFPLLPYLAEVIPGDLLGEQLASSIDLLLKEASERTTVFELKLTLSKEKK